MITNAQIKRIKTLQRVCGLDDQTYRDILRNKAGVNSCKELRSERQIRVVIDHLSRLSEKIDSKAKKQAATWRWEDSLEGKALLEKARSVAINPNRPSIDQLNYIFGLWWALRREWRKQPDLKIETTLNHFLENGRGGPHVKIASWRWLTPEMAHHLIDVLKTRIASKKTSKKAKKD